MENSSHKCWQINATMMNELNKCRIQTHNNIWRTAISACGFGFATEWWSVEQDGIRVAQVNLY